MTGLKENRRADGGKGSKLTAFEMLDGVPYVNQAAKIIRGNAGGALVEIPTRKPAYLVPPISWVIRFSGIRRLELDRPGMDMLDLCDGKKTVERIIEEFALMNKLSFREAQLPVTQFLTSLTSGGVLVVELDREGEQAS